MTREFRRKINLSKFFETSSATHFEFCLNAVILYTKDVIGIIAVEIFVKRLIQ